MGVTVSTDGRSVPRGGTVTVAVDGLDPGEEAMVSLVLVERLKGTIPTRRHALSSTSVSGGHPAQVRLEVPLDTPEPCTTHAASISLEIQAVRERRGRDERATAEFELAPGRADEHSKRLVGRHVPPASGTVTTHPWHHRLATKAGLFAAAVLVLLIRFEGAWRWVGVGVAFVVLVVSVLGEFLRSRSIPVGLDFTVQDNPVRRGEDVVVSLGTSPGEMVEVGLRTVQTFLRRGNPRGPAETVVLAEQWVPSPTAFKAVLRVPDDAPTTYNGEWVSVRHELVLRPSRGGRGDARGDITATVDVVP